MPIEPGSASVQRLLQIVNVIYGIVAALVLVLVLIASARRAESQSTTAAFVGVLLAGQEQAQDVAAPDVRAGG